MGPKKKKKGKNVPPLELPLEEVDVVKMSFDKLIQYGLKVAEELNKFKKECFILEMERDKMSFYWDKAIYKLMSVERDIRHLEREILNKKNEGERILMRKKKDLNKMHLENSKEFEEKQISLLTNIYEDYEFNFIKEEQLLKDRLDLKKEFYEMIHQQDQARANCRIYGHSKPMDEIIQLYFRNFKALELKDEKILGFKSMKLNKEANDEMKRTLNRKEKEVRTFEYNHKHITKDILKVFQNVTKHNFSLINSLSNDLNDLKKKEMVITKKYNIVKKEHDEILTAIKEANAETILVKRELTYFEDIKNQINDLKSTIISDEREQLMLDLRISLLEENILKQREFLKELKSKSINCLLDFKEKQTKIQVWLQMIKRNLELGTLEVKELLERCLGKQIPDISWLKDLQNDFYDIRMTTIDVIKRIIKLQNLNEENLGFKINIELGKSTELVPHEKISSEEIAYPRVGECKQPFLTNFYSRDFTPNFSLRKINEKL